MGLVITYYASATLIEGCSIEQLRVAWDVGDQDFASGGIE